jgi:superfamily II DNA or RNA helicase
MVDFGDLARQTEGSAGSLIHPREMFNALPRGKGYDYLRGRQDQVLDQWYERRTTRDLVVKLNTGGGKTVVGLLAAAQLP